MRKQATAAEAEEQSPGDDSEASVGRAAPAAATERLSEPQAPGHLGLSADGAAQAAEGAGGEFARMAANRRAARAGNAACQTDIFLQMGCVLLLHLPTL